MTVLTRSMLLLTALPLLALGFEDVSVKHRVGQVIELTAEFTTLTTLGEASMLVNGEDYPADSLIQSLPDRDEARKRVMRDSILAVEDGMPTSVRREFIELSRVTTSKGEESEDSGALEGLTILIKQDDEGEVIAELESDEDVDELFLINHRLADLTLEFLPDDELEVGDSWTPTEDVARRMFGSKSANYFEAKLKEDFSEMLDSDAEYVIEATYERKDEHDGSACFVITVEATVEASDDELPDSFQSEGAPPMDGGVAIDGRMSGELWISVDARMPVMADLMIEIEVAVEMNMENQGASIEMAFELDVEGTAKIAWELLDSDE